MSKLSDQRQLYVDTYCTNGLDRTEAYKVAYPKCQAGWRKLAHRLMTNDDVKQAIAVKIAERQVKADYNYDKAMQQLTTLRSFYEQQVRSGNISAGRLLLSIIAEQDNITGLHQIRNINIDEDKAELKEAEQLEAQRIANIRLHQSIA